MSSALTILCGDVFAMLRTLPSDSVQCVVTSPPYWGLRDYQVDGQLGLESTFEEFLSRMVVIFAEVKRVLKPDGTCWLNMGDSYSATMGGTHGYKDGRKNRAERKSAGLVKGLKPKDIIGQPWRVAFALQAAGWYLRQDIIWHKPNPMPESIKDRCTKAHEYIFLLSKSERYFYNTAEAREAVNGTAHSRGHGLNPKAMKMPDGWDTGKGGHGAFHRKGREKGKTRQNESFSASVTDLVADRNWRDVWTMPSEPYKDAHFATFPRALPRRCILAGSRPGDTILDPFAGSGTTGAVALEMGRNAILIELNPQYVELIKARTAITPGLPL